MMAFLNPAASKAGCQSLDALLQPGHPFGGRGRIDVIDDRLHGLGDGRGGIFLLQSPAGDVADAAERAARRGCNPSGRPRNSRRARRTAAASWAFPAASPCCDAAPRWRCRGASRHPPKFAGAEAAAPGTGARFRIGDGRTSASIFSGYGEMRSIYDRQASMALAFSRWRALNSEMSVVNRRVTSITAEPLSCANAATGKVIRMALLLAALTACAIGVLGSATTS